jgi:uncharacterized damage-inducible protein DinB
MVGHHEDETSGSIMNDKDFRKYIVEVHNYQRKHMWRILDGIPEDIMVKRLTEEERIYSILSLAQHIANAETYWFHKNKHNIGKPVAADKTQEVLSKLRENTEKMAEVVHSCSADQLRIVAPWEEGGPSVAWSILRTSQHGIYHTGQIAKLRKILGAPPLSEDKEDTWGSAVDALLYVIRLLRKDD